MDKVEDMNSFFTFLQEHIEKGGYDDMKKKYAIFDCEFSHKIDEDGTYIFEPRVYSDYIGYSVRNNNGQEIIELEKFTEYLTINPEKLSLHRKTLQENDKIYEDIIEYFYEDLVKLYKSKLGMLKKCFANSLMKDVSDVNRNSFNEGMLLKLDYFVELADSQEHIVTAQDGTSKNLLQEFLQDAEHWLQKQKQSGGFSIKETTTNTHNLKLDNTVNKFNSMPINMVWEYFNPLTITKSKNGKPHLTAEQLESFISEIFINDNNPILNKIELNVEDGERQSLIYKFYQFYNNSKFDYESTKNCKPKYVKLLTDNFTKYDYEKVFDNFHKKP
jgi:hypothetical protein